MHGALKGFPPYSPLPVVGPPLLVHLLPVLLLPAPPQVLHPQQEVQLAEAGGVEEPPEVLQLEQLGLCEQPGGGGRPPEVAAGEGRGAGGGPAARHPAWGRRTLPHKVEGSVILFF